MSQSGGYDRSLNVFQVEGEWQALNWFVENADQAFETALNVLGWLRVRHAGNGTVTLTSGRNGKEGSSYLHNHMASSDPSVANSFELYILETIHMEEKVLQFKVYTDKGALRNDSRMKQATMTVFSDRRASGMYHVQFKESGYKNQKIFAAVPAYVKDLYIRSNAAGNALGGYFRCCYGDLENEMDNLQTAAVVMALPDSSHEEEIMFDDVHHVVA